jgi:hypothetical protein
MLAIAALPGCVSVNTFPAIAHPGDTVSMMIGGSANANKSNVSVTFTDASNQTWDLQAQGLVRSVFNLRPDGRANGQHYSSHLDTYISWFYGHEPVQTVLVADVPQGAAAGQGKMTVALNVSDDSSWVDSPFNVELEIIPGTGASEQFMRHTINGSQPGDLSRLETAPNAKVTFGGSTLIGAASLVLSFDPGVVNPNDLNVYVPESTVRGSSNPPSPFGKTQRMVYWHQDGQKLYVDIVAPQGIDPRYLQFFVVHPRGLAGSPNFSLVSATVYDTSGFSIAVTPVLTYTP